MPRRKRTAWTSSTANGMPASACVFGKVRRFDIPVDIIFIRPSRTVPSHSREAPLPPSPWMRVRRRRPALPQSRSCHREQWCCLFTLHRIGSLVACMSVLNDTDCFQRRHCEYDVTLNVCKGKGEVVFRLSAVALTGHREYPAITTAFPHPRVRHRFSQILSSGHRCRMLAACITAASARRPGTRRLAMSSSPPWR
jgi:hypothetical protein